MKAAVLLLLLAGLLGITTEWAAAATPTRLRVTGPAVVGLGEEISLEAHLTTADGRPVGGAVLRLLQVGAVGQRMMATATTDAKGVAWFLHSEFTVAYLSLRVAYAGDAAYASASADRSVEITGVEIAPAVVMAHGPGSMVKAVLFLLLGAVWLTYAFAASSIIRIVHAGRARRGSEAVRVIR